MKIFEHDCLEHNRIVTRTVWLMEYTKENLAKLWEASKKHRILFSDDVDGDFHTFAKIFLSQDQYGNINSNGLLWVVDDFVGVLFMSDIRRREALLHFSFFDGRLRLDISRRMIQYIFENYDLDRLNAEIVPFASKRLLGTWEKTEDGKVECIKPGFLDELGFRREGKKRKAMIYKGDKWDLLMYGLLREEFVIWDTKSEPLVEVQQRI